MKIACIGNITNDCNVSREGFIEENKRNDFYNMTTCPGGPASNAAYVIAKYGNQVDLYGKIGNDEYGDAIYKKMKNEQINLKHVLRTDKTQTPYSFIINNLTNGSRTICTTRSKEDFNKPTIEEIEYETGYNYILTDGKYYEESINLIKKNPSAKVVIDADRVSKERLILCNLAHYIICSQEFANKVTGQFISDDEENNKKIYNELKSYFPFALELVITIGDKGYICENNSEIVTMQAYKSEFPTIDTTGAGDIFHGAFVHAIANGYSFHDSLEFSNITASLSTTKEGGRYSCPELEDVIKRMNNYSKEKIKIKNIQ